MGKYYKPLKTEQIMVLVSLTANGEGEQDDKVATAKLAGTYEMHKYPKVVTGYTRGALGVIRQPALGVIRQPGWSKYWWQLVHVPSGQPIQTFIPTKREAAVSLDCLLDSGIDWVSAVVGNVYKFRSGIIAEARHYAARFNTHEIKDRPIPWNPSWRRSS